MSRTSMPDPDLVLYLYLYLHALPSARGAGDEAEAGVLVEVRPEVEAGEDRRLRAAGRGSDTRNQVFISMLFVIRC